MKRRALSLCLLLLLGACEPMAEDKQPTYAGDPERGRELTHRYGCGSCHRIPGVPGANGQVGPSLEQIARRGYLAGLLPNDEAHMVRWLQSPQAVDPRSAMPDVGLSTAEARDIAAFLHQLE
ncbi:c-type cytochrome [Pseudomonas sp. NCHU5208]|uniref:c-type cytochrome n=1 Tax=unclassified Pseudomonas TaxID=196821 RepID=UPI003F9C1546